MAPKLTLEEFHNKQTLAKHLISTSSSKNVSLIEYRTFTEWLCDAIFFVLPKTEVNNYFEAFVVLYNYQLHFYEDWNICETNFDNADLILNNWALAEIKEFKFDDVSREKIHKNIDWIIADIIKLFNDPSIKNKIESDPERWGVYVNNKKVLDNTTLSDCNINNIDFGTSLNLDWNEIDLIFQTPDNYVLFSWGTGA